jgi:hypothetical protein
MYVRTACRSEGHPIVPRYKLAMLVTLWTIEAWKIPELSYRAEVHVTIVFLTGTVHGHGYTRTTTLKGL